MSFCRQSAQRCEPQIPIEPRLIRRINSWCLIQRLRLVAKQIRRPVLSIVRSLKFDLVSAARHHREQPVLIRNAERIQPRNRGRRAAESRATASRSSPPSCRTQSTSASRRSLQAPNILALPRNPTLPGCLRALSDAIRCRNFRLPPHCLPSSSRSDSVSSPTAPSSAVPHRQLPSPRHKPPQHPVVQQQEPQRKHQVIQKRVVPRENHTNLPRSHNAKTNQPHPPRKEQHPYQRPVPSPACLLPSPHETSAANAPRTSQSTSAAGRSGSTRPSPSSCATAHRRSAASPCPTRNKSGTTPTAAAKARARGRIACAPSRQQSTRRKKQRQKSRLQQHSVRLVARKLTRRRHKRQKADKANQKTQARPQIQEGDHRRGQSQST